MRKFLFYDDDMGSSSGVMVIVKLYEAKRDDDIVFKKK